MSRSMPGPGDFCHGCNRLLCRCPPEPDYESYFEASYQAGHEACLADGYSERPLTEWVYLTGSRCRWDATEKRLVHHMAPLRFAELTWRHRHTSAVSYRRWFERQYGHDLEEYLAGYDDAGAGLPSASADPEAHARAEAALDAHEPVPEHVEPVPETTPSCASLVGDEDWLPF
ncbi:hypothetical protein RQM47_16490 [Rubrivirga sp. S365]|uniref:hypothetical protein n=1 Tax=Rubrivirga sp. S365 TaxID=3076080 RepID=UPI0028C6453C|nr:hypothetical protein [Rubrivirga sp. S365]MDT7858249.1 hypothetical protein [Rubrivirga sp. S365]